MVPGRIEDWNPKYITYRGPFWVHGPKMDFVDPFWIRKLKHVSTMRINVERRYAIYNSLINTLNDKILSPEIIRYF